MPTQMWFGNTQRMQWVPAPASGMGVSNVGYVESLDYQQGRVGITRSMQTHKEFNMEFPVQEASGLTGLDVFNKFSSGFYNDLDTYPLFFADPMNYDQNLFPPGWASPGLYRRGWASIVSDEPKAFQNIVTNPSVELNATGYTATAGASGTASGARTSSGPQVSGSWSYRVTWTVATSAVSGGANYTGILVNPASTYDISTYVTSSKIQRVLMTVRFRNSGGTSIGTAVGTQTVLAANTPTRLQVLAATAPALSVTMDIEVAAVSGTSGANWANTDWLSLDATMVGFTSQATTLTYFDGNTPGAGWKGAVNASTSYMYVARNIPTITATPANSFNLPQFQGTWDVTSVPGAYPTVAGTYGDVPYAIIPIPPTHTLHMGITGSATGTARVLVQLFNTPADEAVPVLTTTVTLLSSTGSTRLNHSWSGASYQFAKVYINRSSDVASTITLSSMMAQLWPTGVSPALTGNFIAGQGHRGLKFADDATVESYVIVDPNRNVPVHYKGMSTRLVEAQDKG